jgi:hypothetical protein
VDAPSRHCDRRDGQDEARSISCAAS